MIYIFIIIVLFFAFIYYIFLIVNLIDDGYCYERNLPKLRYMFIPFYFWGHKLIRGMEKYREDRDE